MDRPDPALLSAGLIDGYARRAFKYGACGALAIALHDHTGWPIVAITDSHNVAEDKAGGGSALHWAVRTPDGWLLDIDGVHRMQDLIDEYSSQADEGEAAAGLATRADAWEWYVEAQGEPVPITLAATFVPAVLEIYKQAAARS
jgi:hypothetical protein